MLCADDTSVEIARSAFRWLWGNVCRTKIVLSLDCAKFEWKCNENRLSAVLLGDWASMERSCRWTVHTIHNRIQWKRQLWTNDHDIHLATAHYSKQNYLREDEVEVKAISKCVATATRVASKTPHICPQMVHTICWADCSRRLAGWLCRRPSCQRRRDERSAHTNAS